MNNRLLRPVKSERVSAQQFLLISERPHNIKKSRFIPPKLGENGFGQFEITYRIAELKDGR